MEPKRVELLSRLVPERSRIGVLMNSTNPLHEAHWQRAEDAARSMNLTAVRIAARGPRASTRRWTKSARANVKGLLVLSDDPMNIEFRHRIAAAAARLRLPSVGSSRVYAEDGGLISYGGDTSDGFRKSAEYVAKIANGARAAELPIEQPTRLPLVINLRTATALGDRHPARAATARGRADSIGVRPCIGRRSAFAMLDATLHRDPMAGSMFAWGRLRASTGVAIS